MILIKLLCNFIEVTLRHGCSNVNLLHIFRISFIKNTSGWLLLSIRVFMSFIILKFNVSMYRTYCLQINQTWRVNFSKESSGGVLENFAKFAGRYLDWSLFLMMLQAWPEILFKKDSSADVFNVFCRTSVKGSLWILN